MLTLPGRSCADEIIGQHRLFTGLSAACRSVDPDHLNLGASYFTVPPAWAVADMRAFDGFSVNGYSERVRSAVGSDSHTPDETANSALPLRYITEFDIPAHRFFLPARVIEPPTLAMEA